MAQKHSIWTRIYYANKLIAFLESKKNVDNSRKVLGKSKPKKTKEAKVYEEILKGFRELREFENKINEEEFNLDIYLQSNNSETPLSEIHAFDIQCLETNIKSNLEELYTYSLHNDFYYFDCPSKIYINQFEKRKEEFFNRVPDANELDFLLNEVDYFSKPYEYMDIYQNFQEFDKQKVDNILYRRIQQYKDKNSFPEY